MSRKKTTEEFILDAKKVHGDKYDYSISNYINARTKITINCRKHNNFKQYPNSHLSGHGCKKCFIESKYKTIEEFIKEAKEIHGDKYDYSLVNYKGNDTNVKIICKEHGVFEQIVNNHLNGANCPFCANKKVTTETFIIKAKKIHGDKYDYSLSEYLDYHTPMKIICKKHGIFEQTSYKHLNSKGCNRCLGRKVITEDFINKTKEIHGDKYDYSNVIYINSQTPVKIICKKHGEFEQIPNNHITFGNGCPKWAGQNKTTEEFIKEAESVHGSRYNYSLTKYEKATSKVKIICKNHGVFKQRPNDHIFNGNGCPKCNCSKGENKIIKYLELNFVKYYTQYKFKDCRNKNELPFDFYLPKFNTCIEYDGRQHYESVSFGGSDANIKFKTTQINDSIKNKYCAENNINLIRIPYTEFENIENIINKELKKI